MYVSPPQPSADALAGGTGLSRPDLTAVDVFCGSGAVTAVLRSSGFQVLGALDKDPIACATFRMNHPGVRLFEHDARAIDLGLLKAACAIADGGLDILVFCAPCQPFSSQNRNRVGDPRASLLLESIRFAAVLQPRCIFFENVRGLGTPVYAALREALSDGLRRLGYTLSSPRVVDGASVGVPQSRIRCVMIAAKSAAAVAAFDSVELSKGSATVRDAIGSLRVLGAGEHDPDDDLHYARDHRPVALARMAEVPKDGGSRKALPANLRLACHVRSRGHPDVYGRMRWDGVAPTLTSGCTDLTRGRFGHPDQDRAITLREAALLQTFPNDYVFFGNRRQIATQIGNAVPPTMMRALLPALCAALAS